MSAPVKLDSPPSETDIKLQRFLLNGKPWPKPSPISAVYDVRNSSTRLIILNNKLSTKREGSRLRGQTDLKGVFDHPQPDRHFLDLPHSARERHKQCIISESEKFIPIFPPSIPHPPVWVKKSKMREASSPHSNNHSAHSFHKDIKRLFDEISRPPKIAARRETRLSPTMKSLVNDPCLRRGERRYLANIAQVYSLDEMRRQKINQMNQLIYQELSKGNYSPKEIKQYHSYFSTQPKHQNTRSEVKHNSSTPRSSKTRSSLEGKERRPQTVQPNEGSQKQTRTISGSSRNESSHGENQPTPRYRKSKDQARKEQSVESAKSKDKKLTKKEQSDESEDGTLFREELLNETEDENYDFRCQSPLAKSSPRQNKHKDTLREEKPSEKDDKCRVSSPRKDQNKILIPSSEDVSSSDSEQDSWDGEKEKNGKTSDDTELHLNGKDQVLNGETDLGYTDIKEGNLHTKLKEVDKYDSVDDETANDNVDADDNSSVDSSTEESDTSEANGGKESSQADGEKESLEADDRRESLEADDRIESLEADDRRESLEADVGKESSEADGGKESSKADGGKESLVANGGKESLEANDRRESLEADVGKESSEADGGIESKHEQQACNREFNEEDANTKHADQLENLTETGRQNETHQVTKTSGELETQDVVAKGEITEVSHASELIEGELDQTPDKLDDKQSVNLDTEADIKDTREKSDHGSSDELSNNSSNETDTSSSSDDNEEKDGEKQDL